jgi:transcriptional regulator with XRE-family HTH domain
MNTNERLVALMKTRGWTAREVARYTGAKESAVYSWMSGRRAMPSYRLELLEIKTRGRVA